MNNELVMVYRGKLSKACERCRARRLKCDLRSGTCGQCVRAFVPCSGYRDTQKVRIQNESHSVAKKVLGYSSLLEPQSLPLSLDLQARDAFFAYYACGTSKCWNILERYYHPTDSPDHLALAIEAVSLAYLWHQVYSDVALVTARERYISALRKTNKVLKSPKEVTKFTTFLAVLVLDLFEKITHSESRNGKSYTSHVNGALALVKLRGLEQFQTPMESHILVRLNNHCIASCITSSSLVSNDLLAIRAHVERNLNPQDQTLRLSNLMVRYAKLRSDIRQGVLSNNECIELSTDIVVGLRALDLDMPAAWRYSTTLLDHESDMTLGLHYDTYPHRNICQAWNLLRVIRLILNESLIERYLASAAPENYSASIAARRDDIETLASELCACVPQYVDCSGAARHKLPSSEVCLPGQIPKHGHSHTPHHTADCYTLVFPLYAAGRSKASPDIRPWVIKQLHYIGSHFYIRNAEVVAGILVGGEDVCPLEVYAMLGSYAFNA